MAQAPKLPFMSFTRPQPYNPDTEPLLSAQDEESAYNEETPPTPTHNLPPQGSQIPLYPFVFPYPGTQQQQIYGYGVCPYPLVTPTGQPPLYNLQQTSNNRAPPFPPGLPYYIPQYPLPAPQFSQPERLPNKSLRRAAIACVVTYVLGLFTFFPHLASIILSFQILKKGYLVGFKATFVLISGILELIAWILCACLGWFFTTSCYDYSDGTYMAAVEANCYTHYYGWIAIVVWISTTLVFGIWRIGLSWHGSRPQC